MLTVKCPHCSTALKLREAPASGKVKCPKCSKIVPVQAATGKPAPQQRAPVAAGPPVDPDDDAFDFGRINFPSASGATAVSQFPVTGGVSVYEGPIPGDPLEAAAVEDDDDEGAADGGHVATASARKKKKNPMVLIGALGGLAVVLIGGIVAVALMGGGGGGEANVDVVAAAQSTAPQGYTAVGLEGCVVLMPKGFELGQLKTAADVKAIESDQSGAVFYFAAMNGGTRPLDKDQMRKKAERLMGGDVLGSAETERNGYKGIKGVLATSIMLPEKMQVEIYHVEERFVIIGVGTADATLPPAGAEAAERKIFYGSFKIGPKPSGWFGW
jgi:phage FluMu protein Com